MAELQMRVDSCNRFSMFLTHPAWKFIPAQDAAPSRAGAFADWLTGMRGCPRPWGRMRLVLRQPVPPCCRQSPRGGEGWGTTNLATEQIREPGWSRALRSGATRPLAGAGRHGVSGPAKLMLGKSGNK